MTMCEITTGVELELWVVDSDGHLSGDHTIPTAHDRIQPEFIDPLVEIKTEPHDDEIALRRDLEQTLRAGISAAEQENKQLVPLGTPLTASEADVNCRRGRLFETIYGEGVRSAKNCAGTHIHFQKHNVVDQLNLLTALDPALALVNSSPYYCGEQAQSSSRARAYRQDCGSSFRQFCDLWPYVDSIENWRTRVMYVYERFEELALERGVGPETIAAQFAPEDTVLNPVRLRESQPTVEWRAPDAALPSEIIDLAVDVGSLVAQTDHKDVEFGTAGLRADRIGLPDFSTLRELSSQAITAGVDATPVEMYLRKMGFDPSSYDPITSELAGSSTLSEAEACSLRLEQAGRLREDLSVVAAQ